MDIVKKLSATLGIKLITAKTIIDRLDVAEVIDLTGAFNDGDIGAVQQIVNKHRLHEKTSNFRKLVEEVTVKNQLKDKTRDYIKQLNDKVINFDKKHAKTLGFNLVPNAEYSGEHLFKIVFIDYSNKMSKKDILTKAEKYMKQIVNIAKKYMTVKKVKIKEKDKSIVLSLKLDKLKISEDIPMINPQVLKQELSKVRPNQRVQFGDKQATVLATDVNNNKPQDSKMAIKDQTGKVSIVDPTKLDFNKK